MIAIHPALLLVSMLWAEPMHEPQTSPERLPRSSIAAVLARSRELGLTPDQVKRLEQRDTALERQVAEVREQYRRANLPPAGRPKADGDGGPPAGQPRSGTGSEAGPFAGGGERGARHSGGLRHGDRAKGGDHAPASAMDRATELRGKLNDADTAAWLSAEEILTPAQRGPARALAEKYRESRADQEEKASRTLH